MKVSGVLSLGFDEKYTFVKFEVTSDRETIYYSLTETQAYQ